MNESVRTLVDWQRAMKLAVEIYNFSKTFPADERFELTQQIRRCAVSVPSNIAEGRGRGSDRDYRHFLHQARGSLYEIDTQVELVQQLGFCSSDAVSHLRIAIEATIKPLQGLIASLDRELGEA